MDSDSIKQPYYIQPWASPSEFIECYQTIFTENQNNLSLEEFIDELFIDNIRKVLRKAIIWESRNENKLFSLSSLLLFDTILKIKEEVYQESMDVCHILAEKIIRVTNLIIDELKKTKKTTNLNMLLVAKDIGLDEFIIQTRHACTHKNLPNYHTLILCIKYLFIWIKQNMWDKQYNIYLQEQKYYEEIISFLTEQNDENEEDEEISFGEYDGIHLEIEHLMELIILLFQQFQSKVEYEKKKMVIKQNTDKIIDTYHLLQETDHEFITLMIFQFIIQQVFEIINEDINNNTLEKLTKEIDTLICFAKFITKHSNLKVIDYKINEALIKSIGEKLSYVIQYSSVFTEILNCYTLIFKDYHPNVNTVNIDLKTIYLWQIGSIYLEGNKNNTNKTNYNSTQDIEIFSQYNEADFFQEHPNTLIL